MIFCFQPDKTKQRNARNLDYLTMIWLLQIFSFKVKKNVYKKACNCSVLKIIWIQIDTVAAEKRFQPGVDYDVTNMERRTIGGFKKRGIYIAFQDTGACMSLLKIKVYYNTCDNVVRNLAIFPQTTTGSDVTDLVSVTGKCVIDSSWTIDNKGKRLWTDGLCDIIGPRDGQIVT